MKSVEKLYIVVCDEWTGTKYERSNVGVYSTRDNASMASSHLQGNYKKSDIEYWVDEVDFCEVCK